MNRSDVINQSKTRASAIFYPFLSPCCSRRPPASGRREISEKWFLFFFPTFSTSSSSFLNEIYGKTNQNDECQRLFLPSSLPSNFPVCGRTEQSDCNYGVRHGIDVNRVEAAGAGSSLPGEPGADGSGDGRTDGRTDGRGGIDGCRGGITGRSAPILFCFCFGNWDGNFVCLFVCFIYLNGKTILWLWNRLGNWSRIFFIFLMDSMDIGLGFDQIAIGSKVGQNSAKTSSKFNQNWTEIRWKFHQNSTKIR